MYSTFLLGHPATTMFATFLGRKLFGSQLGLDMLARRERMVTNSPYNLPLWHREKIEFHVYSFFYVDARLEWVVNTTPPPLYSQVKDMVPIA